MSLYLQHMPKIIHIDHVGSPVRTDWIMCRPHRHRTPIAASETTRQIGRDVPPAYRPPRRAGRMKKVAGDDASPTSARAPRGPTRTKHPSPRDD